MTTFDDTYEENLGSKLSAIEGLRKQLGREGITCPGVLVVGSQSAGKSSVLERLTGISFPRGQSMCTRFPTIVHLQTDKSLSSPVAFVSINQDDLDGATSLVSMEEIKEQIIFCSAQHVSSGCKMGDSPIHVRYVRPSGPVMTLIDLPGITHVGSTEDQSNIHSITAGMVDKYVKMENMIVLVVIPANEDFGNTEALEIAKKYDPDGKRTIGVVSKVDLVPEDSDLREKIRMSRDCDVKLSLGFVCVRNKGPTESNIDVDQEERKLFSSHPVLKTFTEQEWGYQTIKNKIVNLQTERVNEFIPEVHALIKQKIEDAKTNLNSLAHYPSSLCNCHVLLTSILVHINRDLSCSIKAESVNLDLNIAVQMLQFTDAFVEDMKKNVPDLLGEDVQEELIKNLNSVSGSLPNSIGNILFKKKIHEIFYKENIPTASRELLSKVAHLMGQVFQESIDRLSLLSPFPVLAEHLMVKCFSIIENAKGKASTVVNAILESESSHNFTKNDHFEEYVALAKKEMELRATGEDDDYEEEKQCSQSVIDMQANLNAYANVVMKRLCDIIPMIIQHIMVIDLNSSFINQMQNNVEQDKLLLWFKEDRAVKRKREQFTISLMNMENAKKKIEAVM